MREDIRMATERREKERGKGKEWIPDKTTNSGWRQIDETHECFLNNYNTGRLSFNNNHGASSFYYAEVNASGAENLKM